MVRILSQLFSSSNCQHRYTLSPRTVRRGVQRHRPYRVENSLGPIEDLSPIRNLKNLQRLRLGSCSVSDLTPIKQLKQLEHLSLGNLDRLSDYSTLGTLKKLQFLEIEGAPFMPKHVWIDDLKFIRRLPQLRGLSLTSVRFHDDNYHLDFRGLPLKWLDLWVKDSEIRNAIVSSLPDLCGGRILAKKTITKKCTRVANRAFPEVKVPWRQPGDFGRSRCQAAWWVTRRPNACSCSYS